MSATETFSVPILGEDTELSVPGKGDLEILPGGTRRGFLKGFTPEFMLENGQLASAVEAQQYREEEHRGEYTWNLFLREVNHLSRHEAEVALRGLLERDVLHETGPGGMFGTAALAGLKAQTGAETFEEFLVTWLRIANRYAWHERFRQEVPDPFYDPIPPIEFGEIASRYKRHVLPYIRDTFHAHGETRVMDVISAAILYVFGFIAERPNFVAKETWPRAVRGLFGPHKPLYHMCAHPGDYLNHIAMDEQGGVAGFFPTPIAVTKMMGAIAGSAGQAQTDQTPGTEDTPESGAEERKARLLETVSDPCVGTGNMLAHLMNTHVRGEFIDINPSMVLATRAMCAMYAPWFVHSVFQANALAIWGEELAALKLEKTRQYVGEELRALAGFIHHGLARSAQSADDHVTDQVAMVRARAEARRYAQQMDHWLSIQDLMVGSQAEASGSTVEAAAAASKSKPIPQSHTPHPPKRPPSSGAATQLTFFGG